VRKLAFFRRGGDPLKKRILLHHVPLPFFFAVDSIPAVLAVTRDPFVVFTSNVFAILGLRAMYFALAGILKLFRFLHYGLSAILVFIGVKMLLSQTPYAIETVQSLFVVLSLLIVSVVASLLIRRRDRLND
jgi:tellurite resistance protein TerC